jgi:hypothetical protein
MDDSFSTQLRGQVRGTGDNDYGRSVFLSRLDDLDLPQIIIDDVVSVKEGAAQPLV